MAKKKSKSGKNRKGKSRKGNSSRLNTIHRAYDLLDQAMFLIQKGEGETALEVLTQANDLSPCNPDILNLLARMQKHFELNAAAYLSAEQLVKSAPREAQNWDLLIQIAESSGFNTVAYHAAQEMVKRFPGSPYCEKARATSQELGPQIAANLASRQFAGAPADEPGKLAHLVSFERAVIYHDGKETQRAIQELQQIVAKFPHDFRTRNTLANFWILQGKHEEARQEIEQVLQQQPGNLYALHLRSKLLLYMGQLDEARAALDIALEEPCTEPEHWYHRLVLMAALSSDEEILDFVQTTTEQGAFESTSPLPILPHLEGVAQARLGNMSAAEACWQRSQQINPKYQATQVILDDLKKPPGKRFGLWYLPLDQWLPEITPEDHILIAAPRDENVGLGWEPLPPRLEQRLSHLFPLTRLMIERGCPASWATAVGWLMRQETPEAIDLAREAAQGDRGLDYHRHYVMETLCQLGHLPPGEYEVWSDGKQVTRKYGLIKLTFHPKPSDLTPRQQAMAEEAHGALNRREAEVAEEILREMIDEGVDSPSTWHNLAMARVLQGDYAESFKITHEIHRRWPDYIFARIGLASDALRNGQLDKAEEYLKPIYCMTEMHISEYRTWCQVQMQLATVARDAQAWYSWHEAYRRADPQQFERIPKPAFLKAKTTIKKALLGFGRRS